MKFLSFALFSALIASTVAGCGSRARSGGGGGSGGNGAAGGNGGNGGSGGGAPMDKGTYDAPDCMGCTFPPDTAPACTGTTLAATLVYPPDDVLLPPNMNTLSVQFTPHDAAIQMAEVSFKSSVTDIRIVTKCAKETLDTRNMPSGGCEVNVTPEMWASIVKSNRGGSVRISVRLTTDGTCATASANTRTVKFAEEDIVGTVYYWKSTISPSGVGGHIWAKRFGAPEPEEQFTGDSSGMPSSTLATCYGCHFLSRDGLKMVAGGDDNDSDDEYNDIRQWLFDVPTKMPTSLGLGPPGFQTFSLDHKTILASDGDAGTNQFLLYNGDTAGKGTPASVTVGPAGSRPTMPDWSPDGNTVLFTMPMKVARWGLSHQDDDHMFGGSLYTMEYKGNNTFGPPVVLLKSAGENNYYPSYSPDGQFIIFDRVPLTGTVDKIDACLSNAEMGNCPNDSFSNRKARLMILPTRAGATPSDPELANGSPAAAPVDVSNSWPRWTPFIQMYKGERLLWVTFSSTRDYGVLVRNHLDKMDQCYPSDSYEWQDASHHDGFSATCQQPQIWMAPISLTKAGATLGNSTDPTLGPAFWLPFQDITKHNHTAQWTQ